MKGFNAIAAQSTGADSTSATATPTRSQPALLSTRQARELAEWRATQKATPWSMAEQATNDEAEKDNWLLTYMDIVTLLLTLFVVIVAYFKLSPATPSHELTHESASTEPPKYQPTIATETATPQLGVPQTRDMPRMTMPQTWFSWQQATQTTIPYAPTNEPATAQVNQQVRTPNRVEPLRAALQSMALGENIEVNEVANTLRIDLANDVIFKLGNADIQPRGLELLERLATMLKRNNYTVAVEGHTDNLPIHTAQFPSNWELSSHRATQVARFLIDQGIDPQRLSAVGYADTQPRYSNDNAEGRAKNRRVTFVLRVPGEDPPAAQATASER